MLLQARKSLSLLATHKKGTMLKAIFGTDYLQVIAKHFIQKYVAIYVEALLKHQDNQFYLDYLLEYHGTLFSQESL